jgi:DNA-binding LytR/AlgR family response regulator
MEGICMFSVAIVEDEKISADLLQKYLTRYAEEKNVTFSIEVFKNAIIFLDNYKTKYDIVFMDIGMPHMDGMEAAARLREIDQTVILIFVTNMSQFAVKGYEVDAMSFIVKPVAYPNVALKLQKAISRLENNKESEILIRTQDGVIFIDTASLKYIEVSNHRLIYHTKSGDYEGYGTLKKVEEQLFDKHFVRCNSCYLVNLKFVSKVSGWIAVVGGNELQISHPKKKTFLGALNKYVGGGI